MTWLGRWSDALIARLNTLNMTNARQQNSLVLISATGAVYLFLAVKFALVGGKEWTPAYEWLGFLLLLAGLDITQFSKKRTTDADYVTAMRSGPAAVTTTTVSGDPAVVTTTTDPKGAL